MRLSLSIPSYTSSSVRQFVKAEESVATLTQDDSFVIQQQQQQNNIYPLSTVTTPPSINYSSSDSPISDLLEEQLSKDCCGSSSKSSGRTPRKRSVTGDDCIIPFSTSFKRARIKSNLHSSMVDDTSLYYSSTSNTTFPSPSPTPVSQHSTCYPYQTQELQKQEEYQSLLSLHHTMKDSSVLNAIWNIPNIIDSFDTLPTNLKSYLLFQLLKRSTNSSLKFVNSLILPTLKRDFLASLPHELALQVLYHLDARSLCRAASVSKTWRAIIDYDKTVWRSLMNKDNLDNDDNATTRTTTMISHICPSAVGCILDNTSNTLDGKDENVCEPMDIDDDDNDKGNATGLLPIDNPHKTNYREQYILRDNWQRGRYKHIRFPGHVSPTGQGVVTCLQFDDDKIITGVDDRVINIYATKTGQHLSTLRGHEGGVWALQYVGNTLVSGSTDRTIRVWDLARAVCTHVFLGHNSTVRCLQIVMPIRNSNGELEPKYPLIITGSRDTTLRVWRLPDPATDPPFDGNGVNPWYMYTLTGHTLSVRTIAAHGNVLISGSYDSTVNVWNVETGRLVHHLEGHSHKVYSVVIDPDRHRCVSGSMDGTIRVWDYISGQRLQVLEGHSLLVGLLGLSANCLVSGAADGTIRVWDAEKGYCQHVLSGHEGAITCFQHDAQKVISGAEGGLKMWDVKTGQLIKDLITGVTGIWRTAFDKKRCVAAVNRNNVTSIEVFDFSANGSDGSDA